ncbi:hypothetical protein FRB99_007467 [Tulasnella sp. 403]|nr:hypothetical protein FRB99_007467 [Tulasnella sp. 403]
MSRSHPFPARTQSLQVAPQRRDRSSVTDIRYQYVTQQTTGSQHAPRELSIYTSPSMSRRSDAYGSQLHTQPHALITRAIEAQPQALYANPRYPYTPAQPPLNSAPLVTPIPGPTPVYVTPAPQINPSHPPTDSRPDPARHRSESAKRRRNHSYPPGGDHVQYPSYGPTVATTTDVGPAPAVPPTPRTRKRTTSSASATVAATVRFTPESLVLTFPTPHVLKLSNIPRGSHALMRNIREKVVTMWLPGIKFQKEGRKQYLVEFAGLGDDATERGTFEGRMLVRSEQDRRNWGIWTARRIAGIVALRVMATLFNTLASYGFSYLSSLHSVPPQHLFTSTGQSYDTLPGAFVAIEVVVSPLPRRRVKFLLDPEKFVTVKGYRRVSRVELRCVDVPENVLTDVVRAIKQMGNVNASRAESADDTDGVLPNPNLSGDDGDDKATIRGHDFQPREFGFQSERWETKGVYALECVLNRGSERRASDGQPKSNARANRRKALYESDIIEDEADTLPTLLATITDAFQAKHYHLRASIPLPLHVPLHDPYSSGPKPPHRITRIFRGFLRRPDPDFTKHGYCREVWMFQAPDMLKR